MEEDYSAIVVFTGSLEYVEIDNNDTYAPLDDNLTCMVEHFHKYNESILLLNRIQIED